MEFELYENIKIRTTTLSSIVIISHTFILEEIEEKHTSKRW